MAEVPNSYKDPYWAQLSSKYEDKYNLPSGMLQTIVTHGERSNNDAVSEAGARTVFQITPSTRNLVLKKHKIDAYLSPDNAAETAAILLKESLGRNNNDPIMAIGEYHGGVDRSNWGEVNRAYRKRAFEGLRQYRFGDKTDRELGAWSGESVKRFKDPKTGITVDSESQDTRLVMSPQEVQAYRNNQYDPVTRKKLDQYIEDGTLQLPSNIEPYSKANPKNPLGGDAYFEDKYPSLYKRAKDTVQAVQDFKDGVMQEAVSRPFWAIAGGAAGGAAAAGTTAIEAFRDPNNAFAKGGESFSKVAAPIADIAEYDINNGSAAGKAGGSITKDLMEAFPVGTGVFGAADNAAMATSRGVLSDMAALRQAGKLNPTYSVTAGDAARYADNVPVPQELVPTTTAPLADVIDMPPQQARATASMQTPVTVEAPPAPLRNEPFKGTQSAQSAYIPESPYSQMPSIRTGAQELTDIANLPTSRLTPQQLSVAPQAAIKAEYPAMAQARPMAAPELPSQQMQRIPTAVNYEELRAAAPRELPPVAGGGDEVEQAVEALIAAQARKKAKATAPIDVPNEADLPADLTKVQKIVNKAGIQQDLKMVYDPNATTAVNAAEAVAGNARTGKLNVAPFELDTKALAAARDLGVEPPAVGVLATKDAQQVAGVASSLGGDTSRTLQEYKSDLSSAVGSRVAKLGGNTDASLVNDRVKDSLATEYRTAKEKANKLYAPFNDDVNVRRGQLNLSELNNYLEEKAKDAKPDAFVQSLRADLASGDPSVATFQNAKDTITRINSSIFDPNHPAGDKLVKSQVQKILERAQDDFTSSIGLQKQYRAAKKAAQEYFDVQKKVDALYSADVGDMLKEREVVHSITGATHTEKYLDTSIGKSMWDKLDPAIKKMADGKPEDWRTILENVPESLRAEVTYSAILKQFSVSPDVFDFNKFAKWYSGVKKNSLSMDELKAVLNDDGIRTLNNIYHVSSKLVSIGKEFIGTGRLTEVRRTFDEAQTQAQGFATKLVQFGLRGIASAGAGLVTGPAGSIATGVAGIALSKQATNKNLLRAVDSMLGSKDFDRAVKLIYSGKEEAAASFVASTPSAKVMAKVLDEPVKDLAESLVAPATDVASKAPPKPKKNKQP